MDALMVALDVQNATVHRNSTKSDVTCIVDSVTVCCGAGFEKFVVRMQVWNDY
jgi:hypothetical protein